MSELLLRLFVKDYNNTKDANVREQYGILSGGVGIAVNLLLCLGKFIVGTLSNSIAIIADAFNNLSDAGSSIITLFGFKLSNKKADKDHPFGHGRYEYIAALIVSFIVIFMGIELIKSSFGKILHPEQVIFSVPSVIVLLLSIFGKLWLAFFNKKLGMKIESPAMTAVVTDSIGDIAATSATLITLLIVKFFNLNLDGYIGIIVALFVLYAGYGILKDTVSPLLGEPPEKEIVAKLVELVMSYEGIMGIHDLILHNYGASSIFGSLHAEVRADVDILEIHDVIDIIEQQALEKMNIHLSIHLDPLEYDNEKVNSLKSIATEAILSIDDRLVLHDFRVVDGSTHTNLIFDLVIPHDFKYSDDEINRLVTEKIREKKKNCFVVMTVEYSYI